MEYIKKNLILTVAVACSVAILGAVPVRAQTNADGAGDFVSRLGQQTIGYLADKESSRRLREERLRGLLREGFAVRAIGRFVLGKYRRTTPPETVTEFVDVFEDYIVNTYARQFSRYSGQRFDVKKVLKTTRSRDSMVMTHVSTTSSREPLRVDFQVRKQQDAYKIIDIRVEGVSMVLAQRDEFTTYIGNNGGKVRALIDALQKRAAKTASDGAQ
jgi:phospholipid transport system substrate-binding protein